MCGVVTLTKSIVADYCSYCNRHQEKTMPETVFFILSPLQKQNGLTGYNANYPLPSGSHNHR